MFFVFVPPSVTNHPSQTFAKIQRFYNHLCSFFLIQDSFDLECCCVALCCVSRALTHKSHKLCCCDAPATPEFIITGSFAARPDLVKRSVCVCAGCLEMWGLIVHLLTSLFHLVSGFTQKTSVEPRRSLAALPSLTPPLTRACVSAASDVEGFVSEIKLAGGSKQQNLTWLSIIWSTWCRVNSRWLPVELRRF